MTLKAIRKINQNLRFKMSNLGKILIIALIVIGAFLFIYSIGIFASYIFSLKKAIKKDKIECCEEQKLQSYEGIVEKIERYEYDEFMNSSFFGLEILTDDSLEENLEYLFPLPEYQELLESLYIDQKVAKGRDKLEMKIQSKEGDTIRILMPCCN
jgi:hypothetical protein